MPPRCTFLFCIGLDKAVLSTLEKFENGFFTLKTQQMFPVQTTPEKFENATNTGGRTA